MRLFHSRPTRLFAVAFLLLFAALFSVPLPAQSSLSSLPTLSPFTLHGQVVTDSSRLPVGNVRLFVAGRTRGWTDGDGAVTGPDGRFAIHLSYDSVSLIAIRLGFQPETIFVTRQSVSLIISMHEIGLTLTPQIVRAEPAMTASSSAAVRQFDIALRPRESSQELLRLVPGLVIAQHAGGGKAEQIFLRGFDADHGTDVAISVDGTPVNMVSHAHGQGYADLHFLMPEVIDHADVRKGPFDVRDGDFATAGAVAFHTKDRIDAGDITLRRGSYDTEHAVALLPFGGDADHAGGYIAGSAHYTDGPFLRKQDYSRLNGFAKFTAPVTDDIGLVVTASGFGGHWNASGEIPTRAVDEGLIDRYGTIDPVEGGDTRRFDLSVALRSRGGSTSDWEARLYTVQYRFQLFSDFTFFLVDSLHGDAIEQDDARTVVGGTAHYGRQASLFGLSGAWQVGVSARDDRADVQLFHQQARVRLDARTAVQLAQLSGAQWAQYNLQLSDRVRLDLAIRNDIYRFDVADQLATGSFDGVPAAADAVHPNGVRTKGILSPKANLAFDVTNSTSLFANVASGFHSNDARDVLLASGSDNVLPRAVSAELGARHTWNGGSFALSVWTLNLQSELVWSGDEGTTEASGRTRRIGLDLEGRTRLFSWLWIDADLNLAHGRFVNAPAGANLIPLAPTVTATGGLIVRDVGSASGGLRARYVGPRAAIEDNSVRALGYLVTELFGSYQIHHVRLIGTVDNLFNVRWNEAQFATTSRLQGEPHGITELDYTPGSPRTIQLGAEYRFR